MSLKPKAPREMPPELVPLGAILLTAHSPYRLIGEQLYAQYHEEEFVYLYHPEGKEGISPVDLLFVSAFQGMENLSDRGAIEALRLNIGWKYALHLPLNYTGFDASVLSEFRDRLLKHEADRLLFDRLLKQLEALGLFKKRGRQRTDSLAVFSHVRELNRLELLVETLRLALVAISKSATDFAAVHIPANWSEKYSERCVAERLSDQERTRLNAETGKDGQWLLDLVNSTFAPAELKELPAVQTLAQLWQEQFIIREDKIELRPPTDLGHGPGGPLQTPHDPAVRWSKKRESDWRGYKLQVTETFDEGMPHLITDIALTSSTQHDQSALVDIVARQEQNGTLPAQRTVDKGYTGGPNLAAAIKRGEDLIGPVSAKQSPQHRLADGIRVEDFKFDLLQGVATCPAGKQSTPGKIREGGDLSFRFNKTTCQQCLLRARCITGESGRSVLYGNYHEIVLAAQKKMEQPEYKQLYKKRAGVEACLSNLVRKYAIRYTRYIGKAKNNLRAQFVGVGTNLRRAAIWLGNKQMQVE